MGIEYNSQDWVEDDVRIHHGTFDEHQPQADDECADQFLVVREELVVHYPGLGSFPFKQAKADQSNNAED